MHQRGDDQQLHGARVQEKLMSMRREGSYRDTGGTVTSGQLSFVPPIAAQDVVDGFLGVFHAGPLGREAAGSVAEAREPDGTVRCWMTAEKVGEGRLSWEDC